MHLRSVGSAGGHQGELRWFLRVTGTKHYNSLCKGKSTANYFSTTVVALLNCSTVKDKVICNNNLEFEKFRCGGEVVTFPKYKSWIYQKKKIWIQNCNYYEFSQLGTFFNLAEELHENLCRMWGCRGLLLLLAINWGLVLVDHTSLWRDNSSHFLAIENQEAIIDETMQMVQTVKNLLLSDR